MRTGGEGKGRGVFRLEKDSSSKSFLKREELGKGNTKEKAALLLLLQSLAPIHCQGSGKSILGAPCR